MKMYKIKVTKLDSTQRTEILELKAKNKKEKDHIAQVILTELRNERRIPFIQREKADETVLVILSPLVGRIEIRISKTTRPAKQQKSR